jgi:hypothetical protein
LALPSRKLPCPVALDGEDEEIMTQRALRDGLGAVVVGSPSGGKQATNAGRQLELDSSFLQQYINPFSIQIFLTENITVPNEIVARLQTWISGTTSQTLWIIGLPSLPSETMSVASYIAAITTKGSIPCISHFFKYENVKRENSSGVQVDGVISLLYSL